MLDLEWWQWAVAALGILGLSPAPWLLALLSGRLVTLKAHVRELEEKDRALKATEKRDADTVARLESRHAATVARLVEERNYERAAKDVERDRSDRLSAKLAEVTEEFGQTTVHLLRSLPEAVNER